MEFKKTGLALLAACAVQQLSAPAFAESVAQEPDIGLSVVKVSGKRAESTAYNPPTASSATKLDALLRDVPQTVNVVPQQLLRDQGALSMEGAMKSVPGVGLSHGDGQRD